MTENELIETLSNRWREHFADEMAQRICDAEAVGVLYRLVTEPLEGIPTPLRHKLLFRGAYVLERIYFTDRTAFLPHAEAFCRRDFAACSDPSVRRHFGKIMTDLLERARPDAASLDGIAEAAAEWAMDPAAKVAVRVWAIEVLKRCRDSVEWVQGVWNDLLEAQAIGATPGIESRMRRSWRLKPRTESGRGACRR